MSEQTVWDDLTRVCMAGLAIMSGGFFHLAAVQTPGLDPPPETVAIFLVATALSGMTYHLLAQRRHLGYFGAVITGGYVIVSLGLILRGVFGPPGPSTNPLGPVVYAALAVAVAFLAAMAWRSRGIAARPPAIDR